MEVEVYADLLFLINAGMDGLCFLLAGRLLHRRLTPWRVFFGSALGGIYAVASLLFEVGQAVALGLDGAVCLLICRLVFGGRRSGRGHFLPAAATYFVLSMVLGGVMTALYNLLNRTRLAELFPEGEDGPGTWLFALLALVGSGITLWGGRFFRRSAAVRRCRVTVELDGRRVELEGMVDTGNLLRDPLSGRAVICGEREALTAILSPALAKAMGGGGMESLSDSADARRFRLIPAGTATGSGMLAGFLPDRVEVAFLHKSREEVRVVDAVVAAAELEGVEALVPAEVLG